MSGKNTWNEFVKPVVVLVAICLIASALLAVTNNVTAPIIEASTQAEANATRQALLPEASGFSAVEGVSVEGVSDVYKADNDVGYVISASAQGYGGDVPVMVAFDENGSIAAVQFMDNDETPGMGKKVQEESFYGQFAGMAAEPFTLDDIDAITGATISSNAAVEAINSAIQAYNQVKEG